MSNQVADDLHEEYASLGKSVLKHTMVDDEDRMTIIASTHDESTIMVVDISMAANGPILSFKAFHANGLAAEVAHMRADRGSLLLHILQG